MTGIVLRPLTRDDFLMLSRWIAAPHVSRWWADDPSLAALEKQYGPSLDGRDETRLRVIVADGVPAGFLQWYPMAGEPDYARELADVLPVEDGDASLDYLIGETSMLRRGIGSAAIRAACDEVWEVPQLRRVVVPVHADNAASRAVLRRAGFAAVAEGELEPDNPIDDRRHVVHVLERPR